MISLRPLLFLASALVALAATPSPRVLPLSGTLTNTTADSSGTATLILTLIGETATAALTAKPPLTGTGKLEGHFRQGWLELRGQLTEGFSVHFRGALNARDYRGTYTADIPGTPKQYGTFHLLVDP